MAGVVAYGTYVPSWRLRMLYECWLQLRGEAGDRQVDNGRTLTHNLGGQPGRCVSFVGIVGRERGDPR
jgi:acetyl-CoA C-acetyltransferase